MSTNKTTTSDEQQQQQQTNHSRAMQTAQNKHQLALGEKSVDFSIDQLVHFRQSDELVTSHTHKEKQMHKHH